MRHRTSKPDEVIAIGEIVRPHGVRGAMRIRLYSQDSSLFPEKIDEMILFASDGSIYQSLTFKHRVKNDVVLHCDAITDPEMVTVLRGTPLMIKKTAIAVDPDEVLVADLIGCAAIDSQTNEAFGQIINVSSHGASDVLSIRMDTGLKLIPFVDQWVKNYDVVAKRVVILNHELFPLSEDER